MKIQFPRCVDPESLQLHWSYESVVSLKISPLYHLASFILPSSVLSWKHTKLTKEGVKVSVDKL